MWRREVVAPPSGPSSEDRRKHLDFIQAVISRMASASAIAKGWALTIAVATYGYGGTKHSFTVTVLGMGAVLVFAALDAMYLREERRFRKLFQAAASGAVSVFDMDARGFCKTLTKKQQKTVRIPNVIRSWSILNYYGVIFLAGLALLVWIIYFTKR